MINVKRTIFNLEETEQKVCKIGKMLQLQKAVFKDSNNCIPIKIFDKNVSKNSKTKGYQITNVRASIFQTQRILKATETTEITEDDNCRYNVNEVESSSSFLKKKHKRSNSFSQLEIIRQALHMPTVQPRKDLRY